MRGEYSSVEERESDEISRLLEDEVLLAIFAHIVDTGGCTLKDLEGLDAVTKESEAVMGSLVECGILEESDGELKITEKGRNLLKIIRECEVISRAAAEQRRPDVMGVKR